MKNVPFGFYVLLRESNQAEQLASRIRSSVIGERCQTYADKDSTARNSVVYIHIKRSPRKNFCCLSL